MVRLLLTGKSASKLREDREEAEQSKNGDAARLISEQVEAIETIQEMGMITRI